MHLTNRERMNRSCTDFPHLIIFSIFFTLWIGIAIHAYSAGTLPEYHFQSDIKYHPDQVDISFQLFYQCSNLTASFTWLAIALSGLYFIAVRFYTKQIIYAALALMFSMIIIFTFFLIYFFGLYALIPVLTVIITVCSVIIYTIRQIGMKILCSIVQEACKTVIDLPSTVGITIAQINLMVLVVLFTTSVMSNLLSIRTELESTWIDNEDSRFTRVIRTGPPAYAIVQTIIFFSCSLWIIALIYNLGRATLYGTFVTWHRTLDKNSIPRWISFRSMFIIFRYHFGTLTFGSSIFTVVQILRVTWNYRTELLSKFKSRPITVFCFFFLLANGTTNTLIACASHGTSFYRSTKDSFRLIMQNPLTFTATRIVTEWIVALGMVIIPGLTLGFAGLYFAGNSVYYLPLVPGLSISIIALVSLWITLVLFLTFNAAIATYLFRYMEDSSSKTIITDKNLLDGNIRDEIVRV